MSDDTEVNIQMLEAKVEQIKEIAASPKLEHRAFKLVESANLVLAMCIATYKHNTNGR